MNDRTVEIETQINELIQVGAKIDVLVSLLSKQLEHERVKLGEYHDGRAAIIEFFRLVGGPLNKTKIIKDCSKAFKISRGKLIAAYNMMLANGELIIDRKADRNSNSAIMVNINLAP